MRGPIYKGYVLITEIDMWYILGILRSCFYSKIDCLQKYTKPHAQLILVCIWVCAMRGKGDERGIHYSYAVAGALSPCSSLHSPVHRHGTHAPVPGSTWGEVGAGVTSASSAPHAHFAGALATVLHGKGALFSGCSSTLASPHHA